MQFQLSVDVMAWMDVNDLMVVYGPDRAKILAASRDRGRLATGCRHERQTNKAPWLALIRPAPAHRSLRGPARNRSNQGLPPTPALVCPISFRAA